MKKYFFSKDDLFRRNWDTIAGSKFQREHVATVLLHQTEVKK